MGRARTVAPIMDAPTHHGIKPCITVTANAVHTVQLPEGAFTALVLDKPDSGRGVIAIMDHDDVEALIALLRLADEDAARMDRGEPPLARPFGSEGTGMQ
jgi:hypothetical protein